MGLTWLGSYGKIKSFISRRLLPCGRRAKRIKGHGAGKWHGNFHRLPLKVSIWLERVHFPPRANHLANGPPSWCEKNVCLCPNLEFWQSDMKTGGETQHFKDSAQQHPICAGQVGDGPCPRRSPGNLESDEMVSWEPGQTRGVNWPQDTQLAFVISWLSLRILPVA